MNHSAQNAADIAYRIALGLTLDEPLPKGLGIHSGHNHKQPEPDWFDEEYEEKI